MKPRSVAGWALAVLAYAGCAPQHTDHAATRTIAALHVRSDAFADSAAIPAQFTCDGENTSPAIAWDNPHQPAVESYVVILEDPDAPGGTFTHWVLFNVSPSVTSLPSGLAHELTLPRYGATHARNDFGEFGYGGPCPPRGQLHHYRLRVAALDTRIALGPDVRRDAVDQAMAGHVLAEGTLTGTYQH